MFHLYVKVTYFILLLTHSLHGASENVQVPRVAIVGGGIGGSAAAYFLNELLNDKSTPLKIYLYEEKDKIGGRVHATEFETRRFEAGASIIHSRNEYATLLLEKLNLTKRKSPPENPHSLGSLTGIYDGTQCVFKESPNRYVTMYKFLTHYGFDLVRMQSFLHHMYDAFNLIYLRHSRGHAFASVKSMLDAMDTEFHSLTNISAHDYFSKIGLNSDLIQQLIGSASLVNYGQKLDRMHAFVGAVSLAGADLFGELWSVEGGNERLPQALASASSCEIRIEVKVQKIARNSDGTYTLTDSLGQIQTFEAVIFAHPLVLSEVMFEEFEDTFNTYVEREKMKRFHRTVATLISGVRRTPDNYCNTSNLIFCEYYPEFQSVGLNSPVDSKDRIKPCLPYDYCSVYKVFSPEKLKRVTMDKLFLTVNNAEAIDWMAYPDYAIGQIDDEWPMFELANGFFYINSIEWAASAMEMSLIGAKNVALLTAEYLHGLGYQL